ncbi:MAG: replication-associated recombination protein A [Spirochaetes bacterium]|nr:replication-associated recombination protein A [Spirochaetota bacterium]
MELFNNINIKDQPLAFRLKPDTLDNFYGQEHLSGKGKILRELIEQDKIKSLILYGPPGTGKSLIAAIIAKRTKARFESVNAVLSNVTELRDIIKQAQHYLKLNNEKTILFIDEIHRFNKAQQDALLPSVESGEVILVGVTTQNPFFSIVPALQSRSHIFEFKPLDDNALGDILQYALTDKEKGLGEEKIKLEKDVKEELIRRSAGDARKLLSYLEMATLIAGRRSKSKEILISKKLMEQVFQQQFTTYDKDGDSHYNVISAFIKSVRGSDPDAAVYYLARMLEGGEDILFIARRLIILASEDIGNADPLGLIIAQSCFSAIQQIGMPEARIILSQATIYLATAPKSNASYLAIEKALGDVKNGEMMDVPDHLKDSSYKSAKKLGRGKGYKYPHDFPFHFIQQEYIPKIKNYYEPTDLGHEKKIKQRIEFLKNLNKKKPQNGTE